MPEVPGEGALVRASPGAWRTMRARRPLLLHVRRPVRPEPAAILGLATDLGSVPPVPHPEPPANPAPPSAEPSSVSRAAPSAPPERLGEPTEPSLRGHLAARWRAVPAPLRWGGFALLAALIAWSASGRPPEVGEEPVADIEDLDQRAARARAEWAAVRRMAPEWLGREPVAGDLGPGDAERDDDRFADYYAFEADSLAFSVLVTSADFEPDLAVRLPDGQTVAATNLLRTATRAEVDGLAGPGRFEIVVTSRQPGARGAYEVAVVPAGPADSVRIDSPPRLDTLGTGPRRAGRYEQIYTVETGSDAPVIVRVVAEGFHPRLHLLGPNGEVRGSWRTLERTSSEDGLHATLLRYLPGWDQPYRLLVSSEEPGARGPFALDVRGVPIRDLPVGRDHDRTLGDESWLVGGRYVDTYRFWPREGEAAVVTVESSEFAPAYRLWTVEGRRREAVAEEANRAGEGSVRGEHDLGGGAYYLEVTSGGGEKDTLRGGAYTVSVGSEALVPVWSDSGRTAYRGPVPESRVFATEVRRTGQSGGSTFEVGVTNVALSYPGGSRTRVQLSVTVRSVDYTGNWAPWESFVSKAFVVDGSGRRYTPAVAESVSPSGPTAEPGTARRGTVVFYAPGVVPNPERLVFVASIGERTLTLPIPIP